MSPLENRRSVGNMNLARQNICITGRIDNYTRDQLADQLIARGAVFNARVTKATDVLVVGQDPGSTKLRDARRYGTQIRSEQWLQRALALTSLIHRESQQPRSPTPQERVRGLPCGMVTVPGRGSEPMEMRVLAQIQHVFGYHSGAAARRWLDAAVDTYPKTLAQVCSLLDPKTLSVKKLEHARELLRTIHNFQEVFGVAMQRELDVRQPEEQLTEHQRQVAVDLGRGRFEARQPTSRQLYLVDHGQVERRVIELEEVEELEGDDLPKGRRVRL